MIKQNRKIPHKIFLRKNQEESEKNEKYRQSVDNRLFALGSFRIFTENKIANDFTPTLPESLPAEN